jgi:hypothetical protein
MSVWTYWKENFPCICLESNHNSSVFQLYFSHCIAWAILASLIADNSISVFSFGSCRMKASHFNEKMAREIMGVSFRGLPYSWPQESELTAVCQVGLFKYKLALTERQNTFLKPFDRKRNSNFHSFKLLPFTYLKLIKLHQKIFH